MYMKEMYKDLLTCFAKCSFVAIKATACGISPIYTFKTNSKGALQFTCWTTCDLLTN